MGVEPIGEENKSEVEVPGGQESLEGKKEGSVGAAGAESGPKKEKREKERSQAYEKLLEKVRSATTTTSKSDDATTIQADVDAIAQIEEEARVKRLVEVARSKGVTHAFKVALKLGDYYTLDMLHDTLVDNFYEELVQKGFIDKE